MAPCQSTCPPPRIDAIRGARRPHVTTAIGTKNTKGRGQGKFWASLGKNGTSTSSAGSDIIVPLDNIAVVHDWLRNLLNGLLGVVLLPVRVYGKMMWRSDRLESQNRLQISQKKDGELSPFESILTLAEKSVATSKRRKESSKPKNKKNDEHKDNNDNGTDKPNNDHNNGRHGRRPAPAPATLLSPASPSPERLPAKTAAARTAAAGLLLPRWRRMAGDQPRLGGAQIQAPWMDPDRERLASAGGGAGEAAGSGRGEDLAAAAELEEKRRRGEHVGGVVTVATDGFGALLGGRLPVRRREVELQLGKAVELPSPVIDGAPSRLAR
uniref:Uncharacterized protein n=1 Tax=Oryza meridionalis TaxID=40149 RepID=A0A0E0DNK4_9ORYZ